MTNLATNESEWGLINMVTGEVEPIDRLDTPSRRWDKAWAHALANMLDAGGEDRARVIAVLLRKKDNLNFVHLTLQEIAKFGKVSTKTVTRTLKALEDKHFIKRIRNGKLMLSPDVINRGEKSIGMAVVTIWKQEQDK